MSLGTFFKTKLNIIFGALLSFALFFTSFALYAQLPTGIKKDSTEQVQTPSPVDLTTEDLAKTVESAMSKFGSSMDYLVKNNNLKD